MGMVAVHPCQHLMMHCISGCNAGRDGSRGSLKDAVEPTICNMIKLLLSICITLPMNTCKLHVYNNFLPKMKTSVKSLPEHIGGLKVCFYPPAFQAFSNFFILGCTETLSSVPMLNTHRCHPRYFQSL